MAVAACECRSANAAYLAAYNDSNSSGRPTHAAKSASWIEILHMIKISVIYSAIN
jgi:hypothetical protein